MAGSERATQSTRQSPFQLTASGFFVVRTPLLPFDELLAWGDGLKASGSTGDLSTLDVALKADRRILRERLAAAMSRPELREALFLASPDVAGTLDVWEKDPDSERGRRLEPALAAYFSRAAARPTPFGLFAGCTTGAVDGPTRIQLQPRTSYGRHSRLDTDYLWAVADAVERDERMRAVLVYRPNSSLYEVAGRLRLAEARQAGTGRSYHLVAVDPSPYLTAVLERANDGATLEELAAVLVDDEISQAEADDYLAELVSNQILVSDLAPTVTGEEPVHRMVDVLSADPVTKPVADVLAAAQSTLASVDAQGLGVGADRYGALADDVGALPARPDLSRLVQVDLVKPAQQATLSTRLVDELMHSVRLLHRLAPGRSPESLARFREAFTDRYDTREVRLVEALDEEAGIGFERSTSPLAEAAPLLAGLPFPSAGTKAQWTGRDAFLLQKLTEALAEHQSEVQLRPRDLDVLGSEHPVALPDAFAVVATVAAASAEAIAQGAFRLQVQFVTGPSGAHLLGRFCHGDDALLREVRAHLRDEEAHRPEAVFAEIVHLPEGRAGNVLCRPVLRDFEIPYLGRSGVPPRFQLPVTDLLVSVRGQRITLRSRRLGKEVVPRLTTAHAYDWRGLGIYRFLCALQQQGVNGALAWNWGPLGGAPFLPRVVSGRLVLARARWQLAEDDLATIRGASDAAQFRAVQGWRSERRLPRLVALADADNELVTDLDNALSVAGLVRQMRRRNTATLVEMFPGPQELWVAGPEGRFVSQFIVPFVRTAAAPSPARPPAAADRTTPTRRRFPPGSEWLYVKLYAGTATADSVLERLAVPVIAEALTSGAADSWFFLRYADPDTHLRLRWHGSPERLHALVLPELHAALAPLVETGQVWKVQLDTYEREVERYGGAGGIELAEHVFAADSDAALAIVGSLSGDIGQDLRWRLALCGIDLLFDDLGLALEDRRLVARRQRESLSAMFGVDSDFRKKVSARFRQERRSLELLLGSPEYCPAAAAPGLAALRKRSLRLAPIGAHLRRLEEEKDLTVTVADLASSLAHMHVNRVLRASQPAQELVLYEMLDRLYSARAAGAPTDHD